MMSGRSCQTESPELQKTPRATLILSEAKRTRVVEVDFVGYSSPLMRGTFIGSSRLESLFKETSKRVNCSSF